MIFVHDNGVRRDSCSNKVFVDQLSQVNYVSLNISRRTSIAYNSETLVAWLLRQKGEWKFFLGFDYLSEEACSVVAIMESLMIGKEPQTCRIDSLEANSGGRH